MCLRLWYLLSFLSELINNQNRTRSFPHINKLNTDPTCSLCNSDEETAAHLFISCPLARALWLALGVPPSMDLSQLTILEWIDFMANLHKQHSNIFFYVAIGCWLIWEARCKYIFDNVAPT